MTHFGVRGTVADANRLLDGYLVAVTDEQRQVAGLVALPVPLALRVAVRAQVWAPGAGQVVVAGARRRWP